MTVLVAYESKYGATQQIAERLAHVLRASGLGVDVRPMKSVADLGDYHAFVLGSAVNYGSWMKEAASFARRHQPALSDRPVWLFSSGPLGSATLDAEGQDVRDAAVPKEIEGLTEALRPRDHRVFFGGLERRKLRFPDRLVASLPAFPGVEGDFRDWSDVEAWAAGIARELARVPAGAA